MRSPPRVLRHAAAVSWSTQRCCVVARYALFTTLFVSLLHLVLHAPSLRQLPDVRSPVPIPRRLGLASSTRPPVEILLPPLELVPASAPEQQSLSLHEASRAALLRSILAARDGDACPCATIVTTLALPRSDVAPILLPWLLFHATVGVRRFVLCWDGSDAAAEGAVAEVARVAGRTVGPNNSLGGAAVSLVRLRSEGGGVASRLAAFTRNHWQWGGKPGSYALMVKQGFCVNEAIRRAKLGAARANASLSDCWLFHLDVDEALLPTHDEGGSAGSQLRVEPALASLPLDVTAVRILNHEAAPPRGSSITSPLAEVGLFRSHVSSVAPDVWRSHAPRASLSSPRGGASSAPPPPWFILYGNGKAAARLSTPFLRQGGDPPEPRLVGDEDLAQTRRRVAATQQEELVSASSREEVASSSSAYRYDAATVADAVHESRADAAVDDGGAAAEATAAEAEEAEDEARGEAEEEAEVGAGEEDEEENDESNAPGWLEVSIPALSILHYPYARFSSMASKPAAVGCHPSPASPSCFPMGFDAEVAAAAGDGHRLQSLFDERVAAPPEPRRGALLAAGMLRRERGVVGVLAGIEAVAGAAGAAVGGGSTNDGGAGSMDDAVVPTAEEEEAVAYLQYHS